MELENLEYFFRIVETGSFSAAAEALFTTQSSVSKHIAQLEQELGAQLFDRSRRAVTLTAAGRAVLPEARALAAQYRRMCAAAGAHGEALRLAVLPVLGYYGLSEKLAAFGRAHPETQLALEEADNSRIPQLLQTGACDAAILRVQGAEAVPWRYLTLCRDELALAVCAAHPMAQSVQPVALQSFAHDKFLLLGRGTQLQEDSLAACRQAGFEPEVLYRGSSAETIARLVEESAGTAMLMLRVALALPGSVRVLRFAQAPRSALLFAFSARSEERESAKQLGAWLSSQWPV